MELEEAIERLKRGIEDTMFSTLYSQEQEEEDIKTVLKELNRKNGTINALQCALKERTDERDKKDDEISKLRAVTTKQEKMIELIEKECRQRLAFAKRIRRSEKRNPDDFNQGLEFESATIMNLLSGEPHWEYEGKYFDDIDKQVEKLKAEESE
ncbi:MAG: hypothetical protein K6B70_01145 [Clostridia bacterium]|nr:hypothetical protein [Clostridia bacterium]